MEQYFKILAYLSEYGINEDVDITETFATYCLTFNHPADFVWGERIDKIKGLLNEMTENGHIRYQDITPHIEETKEANKSKIKHAVWVKPIQILAWLTKEGLDYYYANLLRKATLKSLNDQKWSNRITWGIAIAAIVISTGTSIFLAIKSNSLDTRVYQLEQAKKQTTEKTKADYYPPKHNHTLPKTGG